VTNDFQCCYCGNAIAPVGDDPVSLTITNARDLDARQELWAHALCVHRSIKRAPLALALPDGLDALPLELAIRSASPSEVVLPYEDAVNALTIFARSGCRVLGWEGWVRGADGSVSHGEATQGTVDLSELSDYQAVEVCRQTMAAAHVDWRAARRIQVQNCCSASRWLQPNER